MKIVERKANVFSRMNKLKVFLSFLPISLVFCSLFAQEGYKITVNVDGFSQGDLLLGYHYGNNKYLIDTAAIVAPGQYLFQGDSSLVPGVYIIVVGGESYFDLMVDKNQDFGVNTATTDFVTRTTFTNSPENTHFFEYLKETSLLRDQISLNNDEMQQERTTQSRKEELVARNDSLASQIIALQDNYIQLFPQGLFSNILLAQREPELKDPPDGLTDEEIRLFNYNQYKNRFWENFDFSDKRLLRTPVYQARLSRFFGEVLVQNVDSLGKQADLMVNRARANDDIFRYTIWFITNHFERSQIMGHDAVLVHILESYYLSGEAFWVTDESLASINERVVKLKPLLIGKVAPDVNMFYPDRRRMALHQVEANYTILYFWDSNCGHCKRETPRINDIFQKFGHHGIRVFSVNTDNDSELWLKAIDQYQILDWINVTDPNNESGFREAYDLYATPVLYLLDSEMRIVAKRIDAQILELFLENELKLEPYF